MKKASILFSLSVFLGLGCDSVMFRTGFDAPIAYTRTSAFQDGLATSIGVQLDGDLFGKLGYRLDLDGWYLPLSEGHWAVEARTVLPWHQSESLTVQLSGTAVMGAYPYGNAWHLLPGFDLIWSF